ncbi:MAG: hypothetical protein AAFQ79_05200 [Pseudomonadota bacterium]
MTKNSDINSLQNQFRGIVASVRSSGFREVKSADEIARQYWSSLQSLLLGARLKLQPDQYQDFISWVDAQESTVLNDIRSLKKGYEQLSGLSDSKPADLQTEILWATAVLRRHIDTLKTFRSAADKICRHVLRDEITDAIGLLNDIDTNCGVSLWSLQLRIALTNEAFGLEAQKNVVAEARAAFDRGLLGYIAYHCGVRNESRTTAERFSVTTEARIARHSNFSREVKTYLRHVLIGEFPTSHSGIADLLRVSQSHHFIDLYEDMVATLQALCLAPMSQELEIAAIGFLDAFVDLDDFRLEKIHLAIRSNDAPQGLKVMGNAVLQFIVAGEPSRALRAFSDAAKVDTEPNPWDFIYAGWVTSEGVLKEPKETRIRRRCVRFIAATFTDTDLFDPHDAVIKLSRNFGQLPFFRSLWSYSKIVNGAEFPNDTDHRKVGLNSAYIGFEDLTRTQLQVLATSSSSPDSTSAEFWQAFAGHGFRALESLGVMELASSLGRALRGESATPAPSPIDVHRNTLGARNFFGDVIRLLDAIEIFDKKSVLEILATSCSSAPHSPLRYKIGNATRGYSWEDFQRCPDPIIRSVAIHMVWEETQDSRMRSVLRFSVKDLFRQRAEELPSQLEWKGLNVPESTLIYFLDFVCTLDVLDILTVLRGTRQVLSERANICLVLQEIDPKNRHFYADEYSALKEDIAFSDGQLIVDSSRIYVETPQLRQWAKTNLSEDYSRYRDLAKLDIEDKQPFDELLAEIRTGKRDSSAAFTAESEADVLLYAILARLRDEFLTNSSFGLDFFLSKRIRHQSFIGSIRAPLELEELITNRSNEESAYKPNYTWVNRLAVANSDDRRHLLKAFDDFSEAFDRELVAAKDKFFQIQGKDNPDGLVFLPLTSNIIALTKALAPSDSTFEEFLDTAIALIWIGLEPALSLIRAFIKEQLKEKLIGLIDDLRRDVRDVIGNTTEFLDFDAHIGRRSSEVQVRLDECASWFARTNLDFTEKAFGLDEAVGMAQSFALSCLPGFEPKIESPSIVSDTQIRAHSLVHLHDQILIALQNAKDHSGLRTPKITTIANADASNGVLSIRVESEVKPSVLERARQGAEERRSMIAEGKASLQTRREGGSGFFKLAAVASQTSKGKIDFGVTSDGSFFLEVQYSLIVEAA